MEQWIGWGASAVLVATILRQVTKQWREGTSEGVSLWLFVGQATASAGFLAYSLLRDDPVFVFTNAALLIAAFAGLGLLLRHRRQ